MGVVIPQVVTEDRASGAQVIDGGLRFDSGRTNHFDRTPGSAGNRKTWTVSFWIKRASQAAGNQHIFDTASPYTGIYFSSTTLTFREYSGGMTWQLATNRAIRDTGWYHILVNCDTTQSSSSDRLALYVNGVKETDFSASSYPSLNHDTSWNNNALHEIGNMASSGYLDATITNFYSIDGQQLDASYFGFTDTLTNTWRPKKNTCLL